MGETFYLILNKIGVVIGSGVSLGGTIPSHAVKCTQAQSQNPTAWAIIDGEIVPSPGLLAQAQVAQAQALSASCQQQILGGFSSSALGSEHNYPSDQKSQINVTLTAQNGGALWCATGGVWSMSAHTAEQAQQVQKDLYAMIQTAQAKYAALLSQLNETTTVEAAQAIVWNGGGE